MEEKNTTKRREWVKNAAIIFLTIMLLLTFFSNTIMNYSLPEVATQYVQTGTITAKVRGTGKVEASDPYNVIAKESRVITSVAVKQGDIVEKDQVIYYLEESESDELTKAEQELEDLELNYMKGLFGANVSPEVITKVANGNIDSFSQLQGKVTDMQNRLEAAKKRVEECQKNVDDLTLQSTKDTNNAGVSTKNEELTKDQATTDLTEAQNRFEKDKAATIASLNNQIKNVQADIEDLTTLITNGNTEIGTDSALTTVKNLQTKLKNAKTELDSARAELNSKTSKSFTDNKEAFDWCQTINWSEWGNDAQISIQSFMAAYADYKDIEASISEVSGIEANLVALAKKQDQLAQLQNKLAEVQAITASSDGGVQDAQNRLNQANRNILEITTANSQTSVAWQNRLADANAALKNAQAVYDLLKEEQTSLAADMIVMLIFVPVSPSGTGNTFNSLIHSFFASKFFAPAKNIFATWEASIVLISNCLPSLINHTDALNKNVDLINLHSGKLFYFVFYGFHQIFRNRKNAYTVSHYHMKINGNLIIFVQCDINTMI